MIVVDTHVVVWDALKPEKLSRRAKKAIAEANEGDGIIFCDISLWEIAMLMHKGRISVDIDYLQFIKLVFDSNNYILKSISPEIADLSSRLFQNVNKDPADRIIAATAIFNNLELITYDKSMRQSRKVKTIW